MMTVRVRSRTAVADGVIVLELVDPSDRELPTWAPGAHIDVDTGSAGLRQYSLCGSPADRRIWLIAVARNSPGLGGSQSLHDNAHPGHLLNVSAPRNSFPLVTADKMVFVAGGIGITPLLPMCSVADSMQCDWTLYYGGRTRAHMAFADVLMERYPQSVRLFPEDSSGLLPVRQICERHRGAVIYSCGPEPLLALVEAEGAAHGNQVHLERFAAPARGDEPELGFGIEIASTGQSLFVAANKSIVDVLEAEGISVVSSCREGICGSCEITVIAGRIAHRDSVLSHEERRSGRTMLPCVSRAAEGTLVLDL